MGNRLPHSLGWSLSFVVEVSKGEVQDNGPFRTGPAASVSYKPTAAPPVRQPTNEWKTVIMTPESEFLAWI